MERSSYNYYGWKVLDGMKIDFSSFATKMAKMEQELILLEKSTSQLLLSQGSEDNY